MARLPDAVLQAWERRAGAAVFTTVDAQGMPNSVYVGSVRRHGDDAFVIADNYFAKTRVNILGGSPGVLLFMTQEREAFQIKGTLEYHTSGPLYEDMRRWVDPSRPRVAAVLLRVEQVYAGAERLA